MPETAWLPLPNKCGPWWQRVHGEPATDVIISVTMYDGKPHVVEPSGVETIEADDDVLYYPVATPPPADGEKLPRRFRMGDAFGVLWPNGSLTYTYCWPIDKGASNRHEQWLSDHADEIEWIDP